MDKLLHFFSKYSKFIVINSLVIALISLIDSKLSAGLILIAFLGAVAFLFITKIKDEKQCKIISVLFVTVFVIHILFAFFIFYGRFQPFSGGTGDFIHYHNTALQVAERVHQKNFSLEGLGLGHYYALIVGYLYALLVPKMIIGELLNAWLISLVSVLCYCIVKELGRSDKEAFFVGCVVAIYPSLSFFGGLMIKDAFVVFFSTAALLMVTKLMKNFSWRSFSLLYLGLIGLTHFRFYISFVLIGLFLVCWFLLYSAPIKQRLATVIVMAFFMGFLPLISVVGGFEQGYFGIKAIMHQLNIKTITYYREKAYDADLNAHKDAKGLIQEPSGAPLNPPPPSVTPLNPLPPKKESLTKEEIKKIVDETPEGAPIPDLNTKDYGQDSSITIPTGAHNPFQFVRNSMIAFFYVFFGPFPSHIKQFKHLFFAPEIVLWWTCLFFIIRGIVTSVKSHYKLMVPLLLFGVVSVAVVSLYMTNYGLVTRIRMPSLVALFCLVPFGLGKLSTIKIPFLKFLD